MGGFVVCVAPEVPALTTCQTLSFSHGASAGMLILQPCLLCCLVRDCFSSFNVALSLLMNSDVWDALVSPFRFISIVMVWLANWVRLVGKPHRASKLAMAPQTRYARSHLAASCMSCTGPLCAKPPCIATSYARSHL